MIIYKGMHYQELAIKIYKNNNNRVGCYPYIPASITKLQFLAYTIADRVSWVRETYVCLSNPDKEGSGANMYMKNNSHIGHLPLAMIEMETETDATHGELLTEFQPVISFFSDISCTVGVLLHELAHLAYPYTSHETEFQGAYRELCDSWDILFSKYGII